MKLEMENISDRVFYVRKEIAKCNQSEFGKLLGGWTNKAISSIENDNNTPTQPFVNAICSKFNINKEWLLDGVGDMLIPDIEDLDRKRFNAICKGYELSNFQREIMYKFWHLQTEQMEFLVKSVSEILESENRNEKELDTELKHLDEDITESTRLLREASEARQKGTLQQKSSA
ncbi:hypothetical protein AGMMS49975_26990 [Clostridia bacterium]|nr:hypothetical protein AGMMS49975_26990 [Clostridia bacterium]